jgi:sacsin
MASQSTGRTDVSVSRTGSGGGGSGTADFPLTSAGRDDEDDGGGDEFTGSDFGQKIDLTVRIREILLNYPEGTSIFKELVQNADDANAKSITFCLDRRVFPPSAHALAVASGADQAAAAEARPYGRMEELLQSGALVVHNDGVFSQRDFVSIQSIGNSQKESTRTGKFGLGFNRCA